MPLERTTEFKQKELVEQKCPLEVDGAVDDQQAEGTQYSIFLSIGEKLEQLAIMEVFTDSHNSLVSTLCRAARNLQFYLHAGRS